ncbi:hypothetical protein CO610_07445 [Lysobacteraceae bacterium NML95-0200]|nr:hypothetical protein CO610_07445 [Xanthomonadaceae bacterium NML95-0200]
MASNWNRIGDGSDARQLGANIAALIFGDKRGAEEAYRRRMVENIDIGRRDQALQQDIMKTQGLHGLGDSIAATGFAPEVAERLAGFGRAGIDPRQYFGAALQMQERAARDAAMQAALAGDWTAGNAHMLGVANGPQVLAGVDGNMLIANRFKEGGGEVKPTDIGYSTISLNQAREARLGTQMQADRALAAQRYADMGIRANEHEAKMAGQWNPGGSGTSGGGSAKPPTEAEINRAFTDSDGKFDNARYRDFLLYQQSTGKGLGNYLTENMRRTPGGKGIVFIDPSMPGSMTQRGPQAIPAEATAIIEAMDADLAARGEARLSAAQRQHIIQQVAAGQPFNIQMAASPARGTDLGNTVRPAAKTTGGVAQKIQQAKEALAQGVDPAWLREQLGRQGINPAAAGL